jgi:hypothetical protein
MTMNALDTALTRLAAASTALEYTANPGLKDVENAKKEAKAAAEILDAAHRLMGYGVYTVAQEPAAPGVAMFDPSGQPTAEAAVATTPTTLDLIAEFAACGEIEQGDRFQTQLDELAEAAGEPLDEEWESIWDQDRVLAYKSVLFCLAADPKEFLPPGEPAIQIWLAKLQPELPALPDLLGDFMSLDEGARYNRFDDVTNDLANRDDSDGFDADWWGHWKAAYDADQAATFAKAVYALGHRTPVSVGLPTDEEMAAWTAQHAPAAPQFDAAAFFTSKLRELEETGLADGQKLKDWKKSEKAWKAEFKADPDAATNKLLWRLQQVTVAWGVPTHDEVA